MDEITLEELMPFRDQMTVAQLDRYGGYLTGKLPQVRFTWMELGELGRKKEFKMMCNRALALAKQANSFEAC